MPRQPSPAIGTDIGRYRVEAVLGSGGMGVVYRATDARLGRQVALKVLPARYGDDPTFRARFLRESRLAASIEHRGVIPIYEAGEADGQLYIAMRYVDGTDLAELLRREGALDPPRAVALVAQLAAALDAAHARGLVHRDVKPSNALVAPDGDAEQVYLADFGLSRQVTGDTTLSGTGGFVGTVRYMAPEVIRSGEADARSDLYSLGCLLFECLTGTAPFEGPSEAAVIYGHLEEAPPLVSERRPGLPQALDAVLVRALHKNPDRRWATCAELVEAADAALGGAVRGARHGIRRRAALAGLGVVMLALAGAAAATWDAGDGPGLAQVSANSVAVIDPGGLSLTAQVPLDGAPSAIAAGAGGVWVIDTYRGTVSRIDTKTNTIRQSIDVGNGPSGIAVEAAGVWVANSQDGTVSVISPQTNEVAATYRVARTVDGVCIGGGVVWVASPLDYAVVGLDPETGKKTETVPLDSQPAQLACGSGVVWASSPSSGTVTEITIGASGAEPVTTSIPVARGVSALAVGGAGVWVANALDGTVSLVDRRRGAVTATVAVGANDGPADLAVTKEDVWVSSEHDGTVARIDPALEPPRVIEKLPVGNRPQGLAVVDGALWAGVADTGARHQGGTLRIAETLGMPRRDIDPALSYWGVGWRLLNLTNDGLTAFRREGGVGGAEVVANLAETLPTPSDGGRTFAFRLRRGIAYSTGEPVLPSHIRFGIKRSVRQRERGAAAEIFSSIRGVRGCTAKRCDLSRGILADDATGTIVFRLAEPDADLLYKLALPFAVALPPSVGLAAPARRSLPATGPYRVADFEPPRFLRLERNPGFRSWSTIAHPRSFPDAIVARFGVSADAAADRVLDGRVDVMFNLGEQLPGRLAALRRRVPGQLRESLQPFTLYFVLNTTRAPFDRVEVRRAVSFALDRSAAVAAAGGREIAHEACQILPPGFPGSRPYCPFTLTGAAAGRPDLRTARRLVRRSGTKGMRVTVLAPDLLPPDVLELVTRTLRELGYDAVASVLPPERYFATLADTSERAQIGPMPWFADYPAPSAFLRNFSCEGLIRNSRANRNPSQFCDPRTERLMAAAGRVQAIEPSAADALWAQAERRILDQAPAVPVLNLINADLVSERVGNYQYSPANGVLLDQLWVR
jgi:YVTN family beta-propeller protein